MGAFYFIFYFVNMEDVLKVLVGILAGILLTLLVKEYQSKGRGIKKSNLPKTIQKKGYNHVLYQREFIPPNEAIQKSSEFYKMMNTRRSIRFFSNRKVPLKVIENVIQTAGTSPSGAHQQPWTFVVVQNPELKHQIRMAAEEEEKINYEGGRMNDKWQRALDKIGTDSTKEYIDIVPYIIIVFKQTHSYDEETSEKQPHYYFERSVGIACGMLITAIHQVRG